MTSRTYVHVDPATGYADPDDLGSGGAGAGAKVLADNHTFITPPSGSPSGAAGGDLSGTYPNPSVVDDSHAHASSTAAGVADTAGPDADVTIDTAGAAGTSGTRARSGHGHKVATTDAPSGANITIDAAASAAATGAIARAAHGHRMNTSSSAPAAIGTAAAGTSGHSPSRDDHVHATGAGTPTTSALGDAAATGSGPAAAMTDHKHARESFGSSAAAIGTSSAGAATTPSRSDHVHATGAGTPTTQNYGDSATTGTGPAAAMSDHKHGMPAAPSGATGATLQKVSRTAGDLTFSSSVTTMAELSSALRLTIAAVAGDVLSIQLSCIAQAGSAGEFALDSATIVSGAIVNRCTAGTRGIGHGYGGTGATGCTGTLLYVVQAGDISGGNVTVSVAYINSGGSGGKAYADSTYALLYSVVNLGH